MLSNYAYLKKLKKIELALVLAKFADSENYINLYPKYFDWLTKKTTHEEMFNNSKLVEEYRKEHTK